MDFSITDEQRLLREEIVRFAREVLNKDVSERDREQTFSMDLWKRCAEIGIQGLPVPEEADWNDVASHADPVRGGGGGASNLT